MNRITIICSNPIVEKLLHYITAELPEPGEQVVLLDAAMMERIPEFSGAKVILFAASADPAYLTAAREAGADGFWYLRPSLRLNKAASAGCLELPLVCADMP